MDWSHLDVEEIIKETDKAFLVSLEKWDGEFWIPKSLLAEYDEDDPKRLVEGDTNCTMSVQQWFAEQEGIDGEP